VRRNARKNLAPIPASGGTFLRGCVGYCDEKQLIGQFFTFGPLEGGPSGSSCVASARLRGRGYFFFGHLCGVVVRVVRLVVFPKRKAEQQQLAHDSNHAGLAAGLAGPQLAQGRRGRLPGGQGPLQAQAAEQAGVELVGLALLLGALGKVLDFVGQQDAQRLFVVRQKIGQGLVVNACGLDHKPARGGGDLLLDSLGQQGREAGRGVVEGGFFAEAQLLVGVLVANGYCWRIRFQAPAGGSNRLKAARWAWAKGPSFNQSTIG